MLCDCHWNTVYIEKPIELLRFQGMEIPEEYVRHISPLSWEHTALTVDYIWNVQQKTSINHLRPLRTKYARNIYCNFGRLFARVLEFLHQNRFIHYNHSY